MNKKYVVFSLVMIAILLCSTFVSAGFFDFLKGNVGGEAIKTTNSAREIAANSCNADDLCETEALFANFITSNVLKSSGDLSLVADDGMITLESDDQSVKVVGTLTSDYFSVTTLTGEGNAYACLDDDGKLFRSENPCN